jgi:hypothetical protein
MTTILTHIKDHLYRERDHKGSYGYDHMLICALHDSIIFLSVLYNTNISHDI